MEALQLKTTERNLAKCEPGLPSAHEVRMAADGICQEMTGERRYLGAALPAVDEGFDAYLAQTKLAALVYDPAGELTAFGAMLFGVFSEAWAEVVGFWTAEERDVD